MTSVATHENVPRSTARDGPPGTVAVTRTPRISIAGVDLVAGHRAGLAIGRQVLEAVLDVEVRGAGGQQAQI